MLRSCRTASRCLTRFLDGNDPTEPILPPPGEQGPAVATGRPSSQRGRRGSARLVVPIFIYFSVQGVFLKRATATATNKDEVLNGEGWARQQVGRARRGVLRGLTRLGSQPCAPGRGLVRSPPTLQKNSCPSMAGGWRHVSTCEFHGLGSRPGEPTSSARYRVCCSTTRGGVSRCPCWDLEDLQIPRIPIGGAPSRRTRRARRGPQLILHDCSQSDKKPSSVSSQTQTQTGTIKRACIRPTAMF